MPEACSEVFTLYLKSSLHNRAIQVIHRNGLKTCTKDKASIDLLICIGLPTRGDRVLSGTEEAWINRKESVVCHVNIHNLIYNYIHLNLLFCHMGTKSCQVI